MNLHSFVESTLFESGVKDFIVPIKYLDPKEVDPVVKVSEYEFPLLDKSGKLVRVDGKIPNTGYTVLLDLNVSMDGRNVDGGPTTYEDVNLEKLGKELSKAKTREAVDKILAREKFSTKNHKFYWDYLKDAQKAITAAKGDEAKKAEIDKWF